MVGLWHIVEPFWISYGDWAIEVECVKLLGNLNTEVIRGEMFDQALLISEHEGECPIYLVSGVTKSEETYRDIEERLNSDKSP